MPRLSKIGAAALAAFGWTGLSSVTASYLVVAGGGSGSGPQGAGGGAGGLLTGTTTLNTTLSYTVVVGAGGSAANSGTNGSNSQFGTLTAAIGGGAANSSASLPGNTGGSGGGGNGNGTAGGSGTAGQGNNGGSGVGSPFFTNGGGGGAGAVGGNGSAGTANGAGGAGLASSITGSSVTYAGGGGGGAGGGGGTPGAGGAGGGGAGGANTANGVSGTANTGGGGGGGGGNAATTVGQGGSGVVIISYVGVQQFGGGVVTSSGGNTIHTFNTSGTLSPLSSLTASALVVAGGGGGGANGGGGGAGGYRTGSGITLDTNSIYLVTVGAGGIRGIQGTQYPTSGSNSVFNAITSTGGGYGADGATGTNRAGGDGGSGGGGFFSFAAGNGNTPSTSPSQGNNGGAGSPSSAYGFGGGGGSSAVGVAGTTTTGGNGGAGTANSISGTSVTYAGGGGGGIYFANTPGSGGAGGGGAGGNNGSAGTAGTANTGGGGGGGGSNGSNNPDGGAGGSGVVIISYPGSTQQMAGGTVTVAGGNVIHTFTSSGYLTPIVLVNNSLRFRSSASAYMNRTPANAGNRQIFTWSGWVKRGVLGARSTLFSVVDSTGHASFQFESDNTILWNCFTAANGNVQTNAVFRDPSAWYHLVLSFDDTLATSTDRIKVYVNGVQQTFSSYTAPTQNQNTPVNNTIAHYLGVQSNFSGYFDGYMADINFVDGQALTPNSFGTYNGLGVWQPIRYGGSYGTNGFYLPFTNTTSTTTLGYDFSPQGNNWTTNNISLTAGSTYDSMTDVPTLTSATAANYAVLNPLLVPSESNHINAVLTNGNLTYSGNATNDTMSASTIGVTSGSYYCEFTISATGGTSTDGVGIAYNIPLRPRTSGVIYRPDGNKVINGTASSYGATYTTNDVIGIAVDATNNTITFYKNNVSQGAISFTPVSTIFISHYASNQATSFSGSVNFGQRPFAYTPPTGFVALNTFNLPTPTIPDGRLFMNATLYTGTGATQAVANGAAGQSFQPDLVWVRNRPNASGGMLLDSVRGSSVFLQTTNANSNASNSGDFVSFNSNGFSVGNNGNLANQSGATFVGWNWKAGGAAVTNTNGSINSTVSANTTAGFSIVTYTGNGTTGATVGHGLGVAPQFIIIKQTNAADSWNCYHVSLGNTQAIFLNQTAGPTTASSFWNNTTPSSTVITFGNAGTNQNNNVAYCFAPIAGYSAFGSYTGNGSSNGPFVYLGFRPKFFMWKRSNTGGNSWFIVDTSRSPSNTAGLYLIPDNTGAEGGGATMDLLSNGMKIQGDTSDSTNASGSTYIYMAFAENPFKYANAR